MCFMNDEMISKMTRFSLQLRCHHVSLSGSGTCKKNLRGDKTCWQTQESRTAEFGDDLARTESAAGRHGVVSGAPSIQMSTCSSQRTVNTLRPSPARDT